MSKSNTSGIMIINGQTIDLFNLKREQIPFSKMVEGLQGIIRFNVYSNWSVAEHSFLLSHIVESVSKQIVKTDVNKNLFGENVSNLFEGFDTFMKQPNLIEFLSALVAYDALIHDFSEALTGDIIRPFKKMVPQISEMENHIDKQIREIHCALPEMPLLVDLLDKQLAAVEAYYFSRYYGKTLLNELDKFHVSTFNSSFVFSEESLFLQKEMGLTVTQKLPISDADLNKFLSYSTYSIEDVKNMSKEVLLIKYVKRSVELRTIICNFHDDLLNNNFY